MKVKFQFYVIAFLLFVVQTCRLFVTPKRHANNEANFSRPSKGDEHVMTSLDVSFPDPKRNCDQNQYTSSLSLPLSEYGQLMDRWMEQRVEHERNISNATIGYPWDWTRFGAFQEMGSCNQTCVGGKCRNDLSKITCGVNEGTMQAPCLVYSIGGNNQWDFELDVLKKTPCEVHTFDCTGSIGRFKKPDNKRLHFHHICLGTQNKDAQSDNGEFWTLEKIQKSLKHNQIDLFKMDIEGYEWPIFESWPILTDIRSPTTVLPMQVLVEVHYRTQMPELSIHRRDWKFSTDMINLESKLLQMGYAVMVRDDNRRCRHCTELTLVRVRCPPPLQEIYQESSELTDTQQLRNASNS